MTQPEQITEIYDCLPPVARQEALDFLLFLQQRHGSAKSLAGQAEADKKPVRSIRDNPAFGMWADLQGDSREFLNQVRQKHWTRP
ncbi:MAG: hypothetical protein GY862_33660 [Gammaproteobacteria bacterium]|nr:hypothetical protein [Gammaproteobacteria bacterium]